MRADLAQDALQARLAGGVHVGHGPSDRRVDGRDPLVHGLGDGAVGRVSLAAGAKLDQVHGLARVEVEHVADPVAEAEGVGGGLAEALGLQPLELAPRDLERPLVLRPGAGIAHLLRDPGAQVRPQALPLAGQHPVALEVAEAAVVGDDLEPVAHRLPAAAGAVAAVSPLAGQLADQLGALQRVEGLDPVADLGLRGARRLEQRGREQVLLAALDADQLDRGRVARGGGGPAPAAPPRARWPAGARAGRRSTRRRDRAARCARRSSGSPWRAR